MLESPHKYIFRNERFLDYGASENEISRVSNRNANFYPTWSTSYISLFLNNYPARGAHMSLAVKVLESRLAVTSHLRVTLSLAMSVVKYPRCVRDAPLHYGTAHAEYAYSFRFLSLRACRESSFTLGPGGMSVIMAAVAWYEQVTSKKIHSSSGHYRRRFSRDPYGVPGTSVSAHTRNGTQVFP